MKLYQFPISHFCEKVRWALDYKNLPYEQINLIPGLHVLVVKRLAPESSVPMLRVNNQTIQGSSQIIDYLDQVEPKRFLGFTDPALKSVADKLEVFLDDKIGALLRSVAYHVLFKHRKELTALWAQRGPFYSHAWLTLTLPLLTRYIGQQYDTGDASAQKNRDKFDKALECLDRIYTRQPFLVGDHFSRVDLCAAALLAPLALPDQHPIPPTVQFPDELETYRLQQIDRPVIQRVLALYQEYRNIQEDPA